MKNSFFLIIPEQIKDPVGLKLYEEVALKQWIDELPVANVSLSTRLLHDFVLQSNKLVMSIQKRMTFLELIRTCFLVIEDDLHSRIVQSGFPKSENDIKIYKILFSIQHEMGTGYWSIVKQQTRRDLGWFQGKEVAMAVQRVIKCLSSIVVSQYIMNITIHEWVWIDLHSLYKLGEKIKKETVKVADLSCAVHGASTIQDSYKQIVLLSLANPNGLMPKEIQQVYKFTEVVSSLIEFSPDPVAGMKFQCIILQDEDQSAQFYNEAKRTEDEAVIYVNLFKLYKAFEKIEKLKNNIDGRYSTLKISQNPDKLPIDLLNYLDYRWHGVPLQGAKIFADRLPRHFVIGLTSAYAFLQNTVDAKNKESETEFIAESASADALTVGFDKPGMLSIGSLISFRKANLPEHRRSLGVVNKINMIKSSGKLKFEISLLATQVHAVMFSDVQKSKDPVKQNALMYGVKKQGEEEKSFLIVDSFMLKELGVVRLYLNEQDFPIILRDRKNIGLGYWQFDCRRLEEQELATKSNKGYDFI